MNYLNVNNETPITINASTMFKNARKNILRVPYGKIDAYKSAGWTGFNTYNDDGFVAYDINTYGEGYTVTSTEPVTINGTTYDGRVKLVDCYIGTTQGNDVELTYNIRTFITENGRKYAVTGLGEVALRNPKNPFKITGAACIDSIGSLTFKDKKVTSVELPYVSFIGENAFSGCTRLTSATWGNRLKRVEKYAFRNAPLQNDIILPTTLEFIGYRAFEGVKSKTILVPSNVSGNFDTFYKMKSLSTIYVNNDWFETSYNFDFTDVPSSCKVYVPVGTLAKAKAHSKWKKFAANMEEGAFDFSYKGSFTTKYTMTVTSRTPITYNGVTYAGKAKYVYNSRIASFNGTFGADNSETDVMCGGERKYLMTEIGDSLCAHSQVTDFPFEKMPNLERIGRKAFYWSNIKTATMPNKKISFGTDAFVEAHYLTEIVTKSGGFSWDDRFYGFNADGFTFYADNSFIYHLVNNSNLKNYYVDIHHNTYASDQVAPCFVAPADNFNIGTIVPLDFEASGLTAYAVSDANASTRTIKATRAKQMKGFNGAIITGLTKGEFYKVKRWKNPTSDGASGSLLPARESTNVASSVNTYYWDVNKKKFIKPTSDYYVASGRAYLATGANSPSEYNLDIFSNGSGKKGDVNSDGTIDVTDVNLAINVMLGKASKSQYPKADVNGDGTVDVTDVNLIINIMLGK